MAVKADLPMLKEVLTMLPRLFGISRASVATRVSPASVTEEISTLCSAAKCSSSPKRFRALAA